MECTVFLLFAKRILYYCIKSITVFTFELFVEENVEPKQFVATKSPFHVGFDQTVDVRLTAVRKNNKQQKSKTTSSSDSEKKDDGNTIG